MSDGRVRKDTLIRPATFFFHRHSRFVPPTTMSKSREVEELRSGTSATPATVGASVASCLYASRLFSFLTIRLLDLFLCFHIHSGFVPPTTMSKSREVEELRSETSATPATVGASVASCPYASRLFNFLTIRLLDLFLCFHIHSGFVPPITMSKSREVEELRSGTSATPATVGASVASCFYASRLFNFLAPRLLDLLLCFHIHSGFVPSIVELKS